MLMIQQQIQAMAQRPVINQESYAELIHDTNLYDKLL